MGLRVALALASPALELAPYGPAHADRGPVTSRGLQRVERTCRLERPAGVTVIIAFGLRRPKRLDGCAELASREGAFRGVESRFPWTHP